MFFEPDKRDRQLLPISPINAIVAPRPIGWISTIGSDGKANLAPYSFFNVFCSAPPIVGFSSIDLKDTVTFAGQTKEFIFNLATGPLSDKVNLTSATFGMGVSEFVEAGLTPAPAHLVAAPRVRESPASLECVVIDIRNIFDMSGNATNAHLVLGQVVGIHLDDNFVRDGRFDTAAAQPLARCGYRDFAVISKLFQIAPPTPPNL